jgi:LEM3 (ligand-effect modulator 3) family / CDC50 family
MLDNVQCAILAGFALDVVGRFRQQSLPTYVVTFSPRSIITFYFLVGLVFIPIGAAILAGSSRVRGIDHVAYGKRPECAVANYSAGAISSSTFTKSLSGVEYTCVVQFEVLQTIPAPSYLYYRLTSYFQNARDYARSLSDVQLRGVTPRKILDVETCVPLLYENRTAKGAHGFNASEFLNPCGAIAASRFNDTFRLFRDESLSSEVPLQKDGIAWRSDKEKKFRPGSAPGFSDKTNKLLLDEDFMVWMRLSAFSDFDKLYRIVKADISPGRYYMAITSSYPVQSFRGDKMFFISTMTWFGSSNFALGGVFVVTGALALLVGTVLLVRFLRRPRIPIVHDPDRMLRQLAKLKLEYGETYQPSHA